MFPQQHEGKVPNFMEINQKSTDNWKRSEKGLFAFLKSPFDIFIL